MKTGDFVKIKNPDEHFSEKFVGLLVAEMEDVDAPSDLVRVIWLNGECHHTLHWHKHELVECSAPSDIDWLHVANRFQYFIEGYFRGMETLSALYEERNNQQQKTVL